MQSAPKLRWIQSLTTGTDGILRLASLRADVIVTSTRGMHGPQMSELVFLLMLALLASLKAVGPRRAAHLLPLAAAFLAAISSVPARADNGDWLSNFYGGLRVGESTSSMTAARGVNVIFHRVSFASALALHNPGSARPERNLLAPILPEPCGPMDFR